MRTYTLLFLLLCSTLGISQNCEYTLTGTVTDHHDNSALVGAVLTIAGSEQSVMTDFDGKFTFTKLCNDTYFIQISHENCETKGYQAKVNGNTVKNFNLEHHLEEINEVYLKGKAFSDKSKSLSESTISKEELEQYSSQTLGDALKTLSGVSTLNTGNTVVKPMINGLHSSRVVIINNGVRMEDQEWGAEHAPNVDINSINHLTLIKGAGALQYSGDAVGGVIVAESFKAPIKDSLYGKTISTLASNGRGGSITTQLTKSYKNGWYSKLQGTVKRFGDFETPDYVLSNTGLFERNASVNIGYNGLNKGIEAYYSYFKNEIGILRASHIGGANDLYKAINSDEPLVIKDFTYVINAPNQDVTHQLGRIKAFKKFNKLGKVSLQYDFQRNKRLEFDVRRGDDKDKASLDLALNTHTLLLDLDTHFNDDTNFKTGIMGKFQDNFADPNTGVRRLIPDYDQYDLGAYAVINHQLNDQLLIEAGGRFDYTHMNSLKYYRKSFWESRNYDEIYSGIVIEVPGVTNQVLANPKLNFYNSSATLGANYEFSDANKLFFNYSLASRAPNPSELFSEGLHHSASRIEIGDLSFKSEISNKVSLTFQYERKKFNFTVNPFINMINDFIVIEPKGLQTTIRGAFQVWEYRQTNAQLLGVDFDASYQFAKNFVYNHQMSIVKGKDRSKNEPLINMPPVNITNEIAYHNKTYKNLRLSLQSLYTFRQNEYPNNNFEAFIAETNSTVLVDVSTPTKAFHLLNFNSSIDFKVSKKATATVGLSVQNVMNTSYRNYLNRLRYYADDLGRNFLLNIKLNY